MKKAVSFIASYLLAYWYVCAMLFGFGIGEEPWETYPWAVSVFAVVFAGWGLGVLLRRHKSEIVLLAGSSIVQPKEAATQAEANTPQCVEACGGNDMGYMSAVQADKKVLMRSLPKESFFWLACLLGMALALALGRGNAVAFLLYWAMHALAAYWILCAAGLLTESDSGPFFPLDVFRALVTVPFGHFFLRIVTLAVTVRDLLTVRKNKLSARSVGVTVLLLAAAIPCFVLAGSLLSGADEAFAEVWGALCRGFTFAGWPEWLNGEIRSRMVWSLPVGAYLYGLVEGSAALCEKRQTAPQATGTALRAQAELLRVAPEGTLTVILAAFCALYAVFFAVRAGNLFGAFSGIVPGTQTAAQYARQAFFELCQVMALNGALLAAVAKLTHAPLRRTRGLKNVSLLLMAESLLLAVTACSKLYLYIERFGFTSMRLLAFWGILVLAAGVVLAIVSICRPCKAIQKWIWFAAATFTVLCFF